LASLSQTSPALTPVALSPVDSTDYVVDTVTHHVISLEYTFGTPSNFYGCDASNVHTFDVSPSDGSRTEITSPAITSQLLLADVEGRFLFDLHCVYTGLPPQGSTLSAPLGVDLWTITGDQYTLVTGSPFGDATELLAEHPSGNFLYVRGPAGIEVLSVSSDGQLTQTSAIADPPPPVSETMVLSPSGQHAYLAFVQDQTTGVTTINVYTVSQQDGSLTLQSRTDTASTSLAIVMHPSGNFLYAYQCGDILKFPLDSVGDLQTPTTTTNVAACAMVFDKTGNFAFVNQGLSYLGMFSVDPVTGELTGIDNTPPFSEYGTKMYLID
jgi:hypothetical protein